MKVFFRPEQVAHTRSFSLSPRKPQLVVDDWLSDTHIHAEICSFEPALPKTIALAHDAQYVTGVLNGEIKNGFGNCDMAVAASLPYTTGSLVAAAEHAILHNEVVCSPTSGFHHAGYESAEGFCTFNGLVVTALAMRKAGLVQRVAILDCDAHYGNGTNDIIGRLGIRWFSHHTQGGKFHARSDVRSGAYERWLDKAIQQCMSCDLVLYQAGADPHVNDPLGGLLTSAEMADRDRMVLERLGHLPLVWNLAGGYQTTTGETDAHILEPVLALHRATARIHTALFG